MDARTAAIAIVLLVLGIILYIDYTTGPILELPSTTSCIKAAGFYWWNAAIKEKNADMCDNEPNPNIRTSCNAQLAGDYNVCSAADERSRPLCYAISTGDLRYCDAFFGNDVAECKALAHREPQYCSGINSENERNACITRSTGDFSYVKKSAKAYCD